MKRAGSRERQGEEGLVERGKASRADGVEAVEVVEQLRGRVIKHSKAG